MSGMMPLPCSTCIQSRKLIIVVRETHKTTNNMKKLRKKCTIKHFNWS